MKYTLIVADCGDGMKRFYTLQEMLDFIHECISAGAPLTSVVRTEAPLSLQVPTR